MNEEEAAPWEFLLKAARDFCFITVTCMNVWAGCGLSFHPLSAASALPGKRYFRFLYVCVFSRARSKERGDYKVFSANNKISSGTNTPHFFLWESAHVNVYIHCALRGNFERDWKNKERGVEAENYSENIQCEAWDFHLRSHVSASILMSNNFYFCHFSSNVEQWTSYLCIHGWPEWELQNSKKSTLTTICWRGHLYKN
jgi:hypothetical protein